MSEFGCPECGLHFVVAGQAVPAVIPEHRLAVNVSRAGMPSLRQGPPCSGSGGSMPCLTCGGKCEVVVEATDGITSLMLAPCPDCASGTIYEVSTATEATP
jgi:hypothetical protein